MDSANFNKTVSYRGLNDNYIDELPSLTLIKPHGSVNWEYDSKKVAIRNEVVSKPLIVAPYHEESKHTFFMIC